MRHSNKSDESKKENKSKNGLYMRILIIHSNYGVFGGGEVYVNSLINLLKNHGNEVFLFSFSDNEEYSDDTRLILRDRFYDQEQNPILFFIRYLRRFYIDPKVISQLRHWILVIRPDIIHVHANDKYGISVLVAVMGFKIPIIQSIHAYTVVCMSDTSKKPSGELCSYSYGLTCFHNKCLPFWKLLAIVPSYALKWNLTKKVVDRLIAPNIQLHDRLISCGAKKVAVIEHFVERPSKQPDINSVQKGNILCVGRISREKGFQFVIQAMVKIQHEAPWAVLHICGEGPYLDKLKRISSELKIDNAVIFHGYVNPSDLEAFYERANIVVFPSMCLEICGLVNLEALAHARPLIISNQCGVDELFADRRIGYSTNPSDIIALAENILSIIENPDLFQEMSKNAYALFLERFSPESHYEKLLAAYKAIISPHHT